MDIGNSIERAFNEFFEWLPVVLAALAILLIGYIVAKVVSNVVKRLLHRAGFDRVVHGAPGGGYVERVTQRPSGVIGTLAFWAIWLGAISIALSTLGIDAVSEFVAAVWAYLPNVVVALLIFLVAGAVAAGVATLVTRVMGNTPLGKIVATAAPILVMTIATFMILDQLMIAENIVTITYAGLIGAIALGSALAFGLGGRDVARQALETAVEKTQDKKRFRYDGTRVVVPAGADTDATSRSSTDTY